MTIIRDVTDASQNERLIGSHAVRPGERERARARARRRARERETASEGERECVRGLVGGGEDIITENERLVRSHGVRLGERERERERKRERERESMCVRESEQEESAQERETE